MPFGTVAVSCCPALSGLGLRPRSAPGTMRSRKLSTGPLQHPPTLLLVTLLSPLFLYCWSISPSPPSAPFPISFSFCFCLSDSSSASSSTSVPCPGVCPSVPSSLSIPVFSFPVIFSHLCLSPSPVSPSLSPVSVSFLTPVFLSYSPCPPSQSHDQPWDLPGEAEDPNLGALALSHFGPK